MPSIPSENTSKEYLANLNKYGEDLFYQQLLYHSLLKLEVNQEYILLNMSDGFFKLFRRTGEEKYFTLGKIFRRAAHVVYRKFLKKEKIKPDFKRFLNIL